jgi:cell division transport system permease protein
LRDWLTECFPGLFPGRAGEPPIVPRSGAAAALTTLAALAMSFLAVLAVAAGLAADRLASSWRSELAGAATVRVIAPKAEMEARITDALVVLSSAPGVESARLLTDAELQALIEPWLGEGDWLDDLPVPRLIDVRLAGPGPDAKVLQAQLDAAAPGAVYDGHGAWREALTGAATALTRLAWAAAGLIVLAASAMVALAARATLAGNAEVVRVLRLIGSEDRFIEGAFVRRVTARAVLGGGIGAAMGVAALALMPDLAPGTPLAVAPGPGDWAGWLLLLGAIPLAMALAAWAAARQAVRLLLRQMV